MPNSSHNTNITSRAIVRTIPADIWGDFSHNQNMARRGDPKGAVNWYLPEWMAAHGLTGRGAQSKMMKLTGWSRATMSQLFNGSQDYSPKVVNEAARALNVEPWELLMPPERAMAIRRLQSSAREIVSLAHDAEIAKASAEVVEMRNGTDG